MAQQEKFIRVRSSSSSLEFSLKVIEVDDVKNLEEKLFGGSQEEKRPEQPYIFPSTSNKEGNVVTAVETEVAPKVESQYDQLISQIWDNISDTNLGSLTMGEFVGQALLDDGNEFPKANNLDSFSSKLPVVILFKVEYMNSSATKGLAEFLADCCQKVKTIKNKIYFICVDADVDMQECIKELAEIAEFKVWFLKT